MSVPKLRFPEFKNAGEWEEEPLSKIADRITQRNSTNSVTRVLSNSAVDGVVDQRDYFEKDIANQDNLQNYFVVDKGDYVYNPRVSTTAPVGPISRNKIGKGLISPLYTVFRFKDKSNDFYEQLFRTNLWHKYLKIVSNMGARHDRMAISNDDFMSMPLPFPHPNEQQKIADCLSSLDDLIAAHNQKLAALKTHKKGLLQQLFPTEGETVPKLRFQEFGDKGEWEETALDRVSSSIFDGTHFTPEYVPFGIPFYSVENLISGVSNKFITKEAYIAATKKNRPEKGDLIITRIGKIGYSKVIDWEHSFSIYVTLAIVKKSHRFNSNYLCSYVQSPRYQTEIMSKALLNAVPCKINMDALRLTNILLPSMPEQDKIADCLSSLDDLITAQEQKIEALRLHKKGLMQQLFPQCGEAGA